MSCKTLLAYFFNLKIGALNNHITILNVFINISFHSIIVHWVFFYPFMLKKLKLSQRAPRIMVKYIEYHVMVLCISFLLLLVCQECKFMSCIYISHESIFIWMNFISNITVLGFIGRKIDINDVKTVRGPACWTYCLKDKDNSWCCCGKFGDKSICKPFPDACERHCKETKHCCKPPSIDIKWW